MPQLHVKSLSYLTVIEQMPQLLSFVSTHKRDWEQQGWGAGVHLEKAKHRGGQGDDNREM
jgi:hypothetical protein